MWWNGPAWGPVSGWWIMLLIGIVFMVVCLFIISRVFGIGAGSGCMIPKNNANTNYPKNDEKIDELKKEIQSLKEDIRNLKVRS